MLYRVQPNNSTPSKVTGRNIAHAHRTIAERAFLAADLRLHRIQLIHPKIGQCAALLHVCRPYVQSAIAIADNVDLREAVLAGRVPLFEAAKTQPETLAVHLIRASRDELLEAARVVGPAFVWDAMVNPLL